MLTVECGAGQGLGTRAFAGTMMAAAGCGLLGGLRSAVRGPGWCVAGPDQDQSGRSGTGVGRRKGAEECSNCWPGVERGRWVFSGILILSARPVAQGLGA